MSLTAGLRRLLALGCAGLVLALAVFAASPVAHGFVHDDADNPAAGDHACAVVLFASGVSLPVGPIAIAPPTTIAVGVSPISAADVFLVSPRFLRLPGRGPPASPVS